MTQQKSIYELENNLIVFELDDYDNEENILAA